MAQVFPCEFCGISENTLFTEHLWATASELYPSQQNLREKFPQMVEVVREVIFHTPLKSNLRHLQVYNFKFYLYHPFYK